MNVIPIVFNAEFLRRIRSRSYIIATVLMMLGIVLLAYLPGLLANQFTSATRGIVLIGAPDLTGRAKALLAKDFDIVATYPSIEGVPTLAFLDKNKKASAAAVLEHGGRGLKVTVYARDVAMFRGAFARDLVPLNVALATKLSPAQIDPLLTVPVDVKSLDTKFADESAANIAKGIAYGFVLVLYISIFINAQNVMTSVAEEKTNRISEILAATIPPSQLLFGKILAAGATGFIQIALWVGTGIALGPIALHSFADDSTTKGGHATAVASSLPDQLGPAVIAAFLLFFLLGFIQYATMFAAAASLVNRTEDLGSLAAPLYFPVIGGFFLAQIALQFPNANGIVVTSMMPLLSPFVMFTRMTVATVPIWQVVVSIAVNLISAYLIVIAAGKIYRIGLLMYGKTPKFSQILATLRA